MPSLSPYVKPFALPEYSHAVLKFVSEGVARLMEAKDEVWAMIPRAESSEAIPITQNTMPSGAVVQNNPVMMAAELTLSCEGIRLCNIDELATQIDSAAEQNLAVVMPHFFDILSRTSAAAGTALDCAGKPFDFEMFLSALEKIGLDFDGNGAPEWPTLIVGPELAAYLAALPPITPQQQNLLDGLIARKRREYDASRRNRKLR